MVDSPPGDAPKGDTADGDEAGAFPEGREPQTIAITALERDAARLQLKIDKRAGRESSSLIKAIAALDPPA